MAVNLPVQNYFSRVSQPNAWVRPSDWPAVSDTANEVQFLMSDLGNSSCTIQTQFTRTSGTQNIIINWGDGTTDTISSTSQTNTTHTYTPGTGTPCSLGYTTFKIRVYFTGTGVSVMTQCNILGTGEIGGTSSTRKTCDVLEIYFGNGTQTTNPPNLRSDGQGLSRYGNLQYVKLPVSVTWTSISTSFFDCYSLAKVIMPTSASSLNNVSSAFTGCVSLESIVFPSNSTGITTFLSCFVNCANLVSVTFPATLNSCTTFATAFTGCFTLKNVTFPSINACTNLSQAFINCNALEWVRFTSLPTFGTVTAVNMDTCFQPCPNLQTVYFPATCSSNANYSLNSTFNSCINLKTIVFPNGFNPNNLNNAFASCFNLKSVVFQSGASRLTSMTSVFSQCRNLTKVTMPSSVASAGINLASAFLTCTSLETITIPSSYIFTNLQQLFSGCISLKELNWSPGTQNSLTNLSGAFSNCRLLINVTLPTSMNALVDASSVFSSCASLTSVTFPTAMNACTTISSCFSNCRNLISVTLPTSMSVCTTFASMFTNCSELISVTFPATVSSAFTDLSNTFNGCMGLKSITFPTTQTTSLNTMFVTFNNCTNLVTLTNFEKLGSLTATPLLNMGSNSFFSSNSLSISAPLSELSLVGSATANRNRLGVVRLLNASSGQWTGASPQINVSNTTISTSNLIQLFNDIAAQGNVVSKTIDITGAVGTSGLTLANRQIITNKGWTITG
jgi:hypothetical protein